MDTRPTLSCLLRPKPETRLFQPQAEDILGDEELLDLFRIIKQIIRRRPDTERIAKLLFCISYSLGDLVKFYRPAHDDTIIFRDDLNPGASLGAVRVNHSPSCFIPSGTNSSSSPPSKHLTYNEEYQPLNSMLHGPMTSTRIQPDPSSNQVMEPRQRGFYYQYGRIEREPPLLRRFAEQGVLTQASLLRKRRRQCSDSDNPYVLTTLPAPTKKPKIPHRHGEFEQRRDDIIQRMRSITLADLEQKSIRLAPDITLAIEQAEPPSSLQLASMTPEDAAELLEPALRILTFHSNMKPHLDNGMNQNGIYYNIDYYRLYLAFIQFQKVFATLFPQEVVKIRNLPRERDRDRDRNMNMKAYRGWLEPLLTETNWAAFRRNIVVGERMVLLTKVVGQGVLLMTKELSGSKLHLTFTNSEWDEFIGGLHLGKWDDTVTWDEEEEEEEEDTGKSRLVEELKNKFLSEFWFHPDGTVVSPSARKLAQERRKQQKEDHSISDAPTATSSTSSMDTTAGQITLSSPTSLPRMHSLDK
ncbi:uncharacterized protein BX664DRAFT_304431 [Halteromyces radiatus]|uniref:uncharacterized protein n=1 Tax=Halteromyces radiatus TaxID=101107 RepID=UPI00221F2EE4|nr:uncharacterized protein BX664DRAFT_304431 [Halteromyces radiatus]KAI8076885.1 hypothetical protein BX664DRAFT_304431 [Halteromyces radiatus]